jgi:hypothetical protein
MEGKYAGVIAGLARRAWRRGQVGGTACWGLNRPARLDDGRYLLDPLPLARVHQVWALLFVVGAFLRGDYDGGFVGEAVAALDCSGFVGFQSSPFGLQSRIRNERDI